MKANKSKKHNKTKYAIAGALMTSSVAFAVAAPLIVNAKHDLDAFNKRKVALNSDLQPISGGNAEVGVEAQPNNQSPKQIYSLPLIDETVFSKFIGGSNPTGASQFFTYLNDISMKLGVFASQKVDMKKVYMDASGYVNIFNALTGSNNQDWEQLYQSGKKVYNDLVTIQKNYNELNGFGTNAQASKTLQISKPTHVYDIAASTFSNNTISAFKEYNLDNFEYKVAEIDLDKLKDQKSIVLTYQDKSQTDAINHDYKIVISNENQEINRFLGLNPSDPLKYLINNQTIFMRDMKHVAAAPDDGKTAKDSAPAAPTFANGKFRFAYDATKKKLSLIVKPSDDNRDKAARQDRAIEIGVDPSTPAASINTQILNWGFLDNTYSPTHINPIASFNNGGEDNAATTARLDAPKENLTGSQDTIDSSLIPVFSGVGAWHNAGEVANGASAPMSSAYSYKNNGKIDPANWLRLYFGKGTKFTQQMSFNGKNDKDNFEDGTVSGLSITYAGKQIDVVPNKFTIRQSVANSSGVTLDNEKMAIVYAELKNSDGDDEDSYLQTDIALNQKIMSFNIKTGSQQQGGYEENYAIKNIAQKTFFENPLKTLVPDEKDITARDINTSVQTSVTDKNKELLADVVTNWSGKSSIADESKILSFKEILELAKAVPANAQTFTNLNVAKDERDHAKTALEAATASNASQSNLDSLKLNLTQKQSVYESRVRSAMLLLPRWTYDQDPTIENPKETQMVFDDSLPDDLKDFVYTYSQYVVDSDGGITSPSGTTSGLYQQDFTRDKATGQITGTWDFVKDANGDKVPTATTGSAIYEHFLSYTNQLVIWSKNRLGLDEKDGVGSINDYEVPDSSIIGWVQSRLTDPAGDVGKELVTVSELISKIWTGGNVNQNSKEPETEKLINDIFKDKMPNWESLISSKGDPAHYSGKIPAKGEVGYEEYVLSKQYIYALLQPFFVKVLNQLIQIETTKFETNRTLALRTTFEKYFDQTDNVEKIDSGVIANVTPNDQNLKDLKLVAVGKSGLGKAANGLESLQSLTSFIYTAGLQSRFLDEASSEKFNQFAVKFIDPNFDKQAFLDAQNKGEFKTFASLLSTIIDKTFSKNQNYVSINQIIDKIEKMSYDKTASGSSAVDDLTNTVKTAIDTISKSSDYSKLQLLGVEGNYSYIQGLVLGKNLHEIFTEYIKRRHDELAAQSKPDDDAIKNINKFLKEQKQYDEKALTDLAISLGYYNFNYFIKKLTTSENVEATAKELLSEDLSKSIQVRIDSSNQIIDFLSKPGNLAKYAFIGVGAGSALIGGSIFGLSFRKSVKTSRKNLILERSIFIGIAAIGIALALFGIIPGLL